MNTFYMVFVEGCATPACKHDSLDSAEKEAKKESIRFVYYKIS